MEWIIVTLASLLAGFVDAIVGGGGLILLPALFATFPGAPRNALYDRALALRRSAGAQGSGGTKGGKEKGSESAAAR